MKKILTITLAACASLSLTSCLGKTDTTKYDQLKKEIDELKELVEGEGYTGTEKSLETVVSNVYTDVKDSTVGILNNLSAGGASIGSGTIYRVSGTGTKTYRVVTNQHVVDSGQSYQVITFDGVYHNADLIGQTTHGSNDSATDIAVLEFESTVSYDAIEIGYDYQIKPGQFSIAIGSPLATGNVNTVTFGIVSKINSSKVQHDASINPGNSGGSLLNTDGALIGVNVEKFNYTDSSQSGLPEGMGLAIDLGHTLAAIRLCEGNQKLFGITAMTLFNARANGDLTEATTHSNGIYVASVTGNSIAASIGLGQGDIITNISYEDKTKGTNDLYSMSDLYVALHRGYFENDKATDNAYTIEYYDTSATADVTKKFTF